MPAMFSKWNGKGGLKAPSHSRYGRGISSTDLSPGSEDASELTDLPRLSSNVDLRDTSMATDPATWKKAQSQHLVGTSLSEFGMNPSVTASQRPNTGHQNRSQANLRLLSSKNTSQSLSALKRTPTSTEARVVPNQPPSYGYTTVGWDSQMDVARAVEVVLACGEQIRARGLDSPLIFSSMALDLSSHNVNSLIRSFLNNTALFFSSDVKFANPHDLAAMIKWTLARLGRVFPVPVPSHEQSHRKGEITAEENVFVHQRGFLDWEIYSRWAAYEKKNKYPATAFSSFLDNLSSSSLALLVAIFSLLSSTTCYSHKNGMDPSRLARLFGSLLFGLPEDETFEKTYEAFVKAGNATEHLLLAYIRDSGTIESLPTRLADHVQGYPAMLSMDISKPSRSVRGAPLTHVNRSVRLYSLDLVQTACEMEVAEQSIEWKACCTNSDAVGKDPQLSDRFRKLINMRSGKKQGRSIHKPKQEVEIEHYTSLVDKKWGDFMHEGFSAPDESKLTFDLRESERKARNQRPDSVHWSQFEKSGFVFADDGLASVLSFDDGLREDMLRWPEERAELMEKLRKTTQKIPDFPYDTTPYVVSSPSLDLIANGQWDKKPVSKFDEVFAEVFADVLLGNGWSNRDEQTHRNSNFAVVQYKSRPTTSTVGLQGVEPSHQSKGDVGEPDDRLDAAWFVVEEIVPLKYRSELEASGKLKNKSRPSLRKLNIFKRKKEESVGNSTKVSNADSFSFDDVFRPGAGGVTKKLYLGKDPASTTPNLERKSSVSTVRQSQLDNEGRGGEESGGGASGGSRLMTTLRSKTIKMKRKGKDDEEVPPPTPPKNGLVPSGSFGSDDFDTRSIHDAEMDDFNQSDSRKRGLLKAGRRQSKDDSWLDVMIRANGFRMAGQDATMPSNGATTAKKEGIEDGDKTPTMESPSPLLSRDSVSPSPASAIPGATTGLGLFHSTTSSPSVKRKPVQAKEIGATSDKLQASGWTREDTNVPPITTPKREASLPMMPERATERTPSPLKQASPHKNKESALPSPPVPSKSVAREETKIEDVEKEEEDEEDAADSPARLAYLRPLPPRSTTPSEIDEREKAREVRIQAAKDRAKELRANLNPVVLHELENRKDPNNNKPLPAALLTPVKSPLHDARTPSPQSSTSSTFARQQNLPPKDDPFAKDRFSGRVASVASKFGGGGTTTSTGKPLTPQSTGNSVKATATSSPIGGKSGVAAISSPSKVTYPPELPAEPSTMDPDEPASRQSLESNNALGADNDSIYPDDAASNFSRDTEPEETLLSTGNKTASTAGAGLLPVSLRPGGSIAAVNNSLSPSNRSEGFPDSGRREEEDRPMSMEPSFRIPYQPGMPLSNLEEESESVLSGSNNA